MTARNLICLATAMFASAACTEVESPSPPIEMATSLQADAREYSSQGKTIVVFISQHNCEFCALLRRDVLHPMIRRGDLDKRIELREVSLDMDFELIDFQGLTTKGLDFAQRYDAYVTPTLLFLDAAGNSLTEPLVGTGNIEFYSFYLQQKIDEASRALTLP